MNSGAGLRPRNISWSSVDLRRCGQPDTPNSLSRSNLIGRPQRLYGRPCVENGQCVYAMHEITPRNAQIPVHLSLSLSFSLYIAYISLCPAYAQLPDSPGSRQCCSIRHCSSVVSGYTNLTRLHYHPFATLLP